MRIPLILSILFAAIPPSMAAAQDAAAPAAAVESPLQHAIAAGDLPAVQQALEAGADPNALIDYGYGPSSALAPLGLVFDAWPPDTEGMADVVRLLLEAGADANAPLGPAEGATPLLVGIHASGEVVRMLLEAGADPNIGTCETFGLGIMTPIVVATDMENDELIAILQAAGAATSSVEHAIAQDADAAALHAAVFAKDVGAVRRLLASGHDPNAVVHGLKSSDGDVDRLTPLRMAFHPGASQPEPPLYAELIGALLDSGADPDQGFDLPCTTDQPTPLLIAAGLDEPEVIRMLLAAGADPNIAPPAMSAERMPPLVLAAAVGLPAVVRMLLDAGADPDTEGVADSDRFTPLMLAESEGHTEVAALLRAAGAGQPRNGRDKAPRDDFEVAFASCSTGASMSASQPELGVSVRYDVVGPKDDGCRVSLTFESNPNPAWEGKPLLVTLDPRQPFLAEVEEAMRSCTSGEGTRFDCGGPLMDVLGSE